MASVLSVLSIVLTLLSCVGCGLTSGLVFTFSFFAMQALNTLHTEAAVACMNAVNALILQPAFYLFYLGTGVTSLALLVVAAVAHGGSASEPFRIAAAVVYIVGVIGVTMVRNVPLNRKLKSVEASSTDQETIDRAVWDSFYEPWLKWNHVRVACAVFSSSLFAVALTR